MTQTDTQDLSTLMYDAQRGHFGSDFINDYKCGVCSNLVYNPVCCDTQCMSLFCLSCIVKHYESHQACPSCKKVGARTSLFVSAADSNRVIRNFKVKCIFHNEGCSWTGVFGMHGSVLLRHIKDSCPENVVQCRNFQYCRATIKRKDEEGHLQNECSRRLEKCVYCRHEFFHQDMEQHLFECSAIPLSCVNGCSGTFTQVTLSSHLRVCPQMEERPSPFACSKETNTMEELNHLRSNMTWLLSKTNMRQIEPRYTDAPSSSIVIEETPHALTLSEGDVSLLWLQRNSSNKYDELKIRHLVVSAFCMNHDQSRMYIAGYMTKRSLDQALLDDDVSPSDGHLHGMFQYDLATRTCEHIWSYVQMESEPVDEFSNIYTQILTISDSDSIFSARKSEFTKGVVLMFSKKSFEVSCFNPAQSLEVVSHYGNNVVNCAGNLDFVVADKRVLWSPVFGKLIAFVITSTQNVRCLSGSLEFHKDPASSHYVAKPYFRVINRYGSMELAIHGSTSSCVLLALDLPFCFLSLDNRHVFLRCQSCGCITKASIDWSSNMIAFQQCIVLQGLPVGAKIIQMSEDASGLFLTLVENASHSLSSYVFHSDGSLKFINMLSLSMSPNMTIPGATLGPTFLTNDGKLTCIINKPIIGEECTSPVSHVVFGQVNVNSDSLQNFKEIKEYKECLDQRESTAKQMVNTTVQRFISETKEFRASEKRIHSKVLCDEPDGKKMKIECIN